VSATVTGAADDTNPDDNTGSTSVTAMQVRATEWLAGTVTRNSADGAQVTGTLRYADDHTPVSGVSVTLLRRAAGSTGAWETAGGADTDANGVVSAIDSSGDLTWDYALRSDTGPGAAGSTSATMHGTAVPVTVTLTGPAHVTAGSDASFTAKVTYSDGTPPRSLLMTLLRKRAGESDFSVVQTSTYMSSDGSVDLYDYSLTRNATYVVDASVPWGTGRSEGVAVGVKPVPQWSVSPIMLPIGGQSTYTVTIPDGVGSVDFQRYANGAWSTVATKPLDAKHTARFVYTTHALGTVTMRVVRSADDYFDAAVTGGKSVQTVTAGPGKTTDYTFLQTYNGKPIRWNPCHVISYRVNLKYAPAGVMTDIREALRRITLATGIHFKYVGTTSWLPRADYKGWPGTSNAVIAWSPRDPMNMSQSWTTWIAGRGGPNTGPYRGTPWWHRGWADFNSHDNKRFPSGFGKNGRGGLLMHELGHMMGLNHAKGANQIMYGGGTNAAASVYGAGDMHGLRLVGRSQGC
jgi:hypothetical protein